jgi:hypothetical protein
MALDFDVLLSMPQMDTFARVVWFAVGDAGWFEGRGIFRAEPVDVVGLDESVYSDQQSVLDVRLSEMSLPPVQGWQVLIPADPSGLPAVGAFEVLDTDEDGEGGLSMLALRRLVSVDLLFSLGLGAGSPVLGAPLLGAV